MKGLSSLFVMNIFSLRSIPEFRSGWRLILALCLLTALFSWSGSAFAAEETAKKPAGDEIHATTPADNAKAEKAAEKAEEEEHGLPSAAVPLYYGIGGHPPVLDENGKIVEEAKFGPFAVTNSIFVTWVVALGILIFARLATRDMKQVPDGIQNFWEFLVEGLRNFLESILGRQLVAKTFWFFATIFIFILCLNWFSLLPGVGTIGWGHIDSNGKFLVDQPLLRGANADLNMTAAMSMIFFACWIVWAVQSNGIGGVFVHLFGFKGEASNAFMKVGMSVAFCLVGCLEVVSILFRPVSLSFRLYGNIFAGENVLESMSNLIPALAPIIPIPFYFMELLVGIVQALVFMLLTAVFTLLICSHDETSHAEHH